MVVLEPTGPITRLRRAAATFAGEERAFFICRGCLRKRQRTKAIIWLVFAIVVGIALVVAWLQGQL
jgi:hypothetical protein